MNAENGPQVTVQPSSFRQFGTPADTFCIIVDEEFIDDFSIVLAPPYTRCMIVPIGPDGDLGKLLSTDVPATADVVAICRNTFLSSPDAATIGAGRRIVVLPCASTPVTADQIRYFLRVIERTDPTAQEAVADRFFEAVKNASHLQIIDAEHGTSCRFDPFAGGYVWNQQAGLLGPGEQQIAPAGELSVLPMDITEFDEDRRLALSGTLVLRGWPIVHAGYDRALDAEQADLYERLVPLRRNPLKLTVEDGSITDVRDAGGTAEGAALVAVFDELFTEEPRYRSIWELGFGINTGMEVSPANCGLNETYGAADGVVHIGLGLTPFTKFALTFICPAASLVDDAGTRVLGNRAVGEQGRRRVNRVRSASCGCH
ncbi:hypothetical protein GCM10023195_04520 [Actinoallomurus liliacearum]|uniref:Crocagin biosynthetic protein CgnE/B domain-containing protein n=1 Tax=Actinoallomurus liliacearum TaxID=1080073 RepID=A0ABP8TBI7_9ACTN